MAEHGVALTAAAMSRPAGRCWRCGYLLTAAQHADGCPDMPKSGPDRAPKNGIGWGERSRSCDLWPGITAGMDARCSCTLAPLGGVYQVKVRDAACVNHGGTLASALARAARWRQGIS